jgi:hypothetical protein
MSLPGKNHSGPAMLPPVPKPGQFIAVPLRAAPADGSSDDRGRSDGHYGLCPCAAQPQKKVVETHKSLDNWLEWPINKNEKDDRGVGNVRESRLRKRTGR